MDVENNKKMGSRLLSPSNVPDLVSDLVSLPDSHGLITKSTNNIFMKPSQCSSIFIRCCSERSYSLCSFCTGVESTSVRSVSIPYQYSAGSRV